MRTFQVGQTIYHGSRYWKTEDLQSGEVLGWNTRYIPYAVKRITAKRIEIYNADTDQVFWLSREAMQRDGKQYHSRVHEYFYAVKPPPEREFRYKRSIPSFETVFGSECLAVLGLCAPVTKDDVRRAYKRLAKKAHPDLGGTQQAFVKLKQAHDSALRFATG